MENGIKEFKRTSDYSKKTIMHNYIESPERRLSFPKDGYPFLSLLKDFSEASYKSACLFPSISANPEHVVNVVNSLFLGSLLIVK